MTAPDSIYYFHQQVDSVQLSAINVAETGCLDESPWAEMSDSTLALPGVDSAEVAYGLSADGGAVGVVLLLFVLGVWLFSRSWHYMSNATTEFFFSRGRSNIYDAGNPDSVLHGGFPLFLFVSLSFGLTLYVIGEDMLSQSFSGESALWPLSDISRGWKLMLSIGIVGLTLVVKTVLLQMVNSTFFSDQSRCVWRDGLRLVYLLSGVVLWLTCVAAIFLGMSANGVMWIAVLVAAVAKFLILIKTQSAFFPRASELSRLILYFCTLEIVPALFLIASLSH